MNTTKKSLKDRIRDYLIKNINYIVPGILMLGVALFILASSGFCIFWG